VHVNSSSSLQQVGWSCARWLHFSYRAPPRGGGGGGGGWAHPPGIMHGSSAQAGSSQQWASTSFELCLTE
jgi:hypothetical protein